MATQSDLTKMASSKGALNGLFLPPKWLQKYDDFVTKNAAQVSQIEAALRSLTYVIPGRFRDAEMASETMHSSVQLLSLYHDTLLLRAASLSKIPLPNIARSSSASLHSRYTRFWIAKSALYRRVALVLQIVQYTELLCEMWAKRRGEKVRWRVVVLIEVVKAFCRLVLLRVTRSRPVVTPALPERPTIPEAPEEDEDSHNALSELLEEEEEQQNQTSGAGDAKTNGHANGTAHLSEQTTPARSKDWTMPRTGMSLPHLPQPGDISSYLLSRVLTADDIKPATKLLSPLLTTPSRAAEVLHILAPLIYALALARSSNKKSWTPWLVGLSVDYAARQLRDRGLRTTALEREEWTRRGWSMGWWAMRGAFYDQVVKGVVGGVRTRVPSIVGGVIEEYEHLWENYYFSTAS